VHRTLAFALQLKKKHGKPSVRVATAHHKQTQYSTRTTNSTIQKRKTVTKYRSTMSQNVYSRTGYICAPRRLSRYSDSLRAERSGIESRWGRYFPYPSRPALGFTQQWVPCLSRVKRQGLGVDHPPNLPPRLRKEYSYTFTYPMGLRGLF
jgi:hypothetical protein